MNKRIGKALSWGSLAVCLLGLMSAGCSDDDHPIAPPTDFERGTKASARWDLCNVEPFAPLSMFGHIGILVTTVPSVYDKEVDCVLAAANCDEVHDCAPRIVPDDDIDKLPPCGSVPTDHCEGNVAKQCQEDGPDHALYEVSYDCSLAHATCVEGTRKDGNPYADCKGSEAPCAGHTASYCDGSRAIICGEEWDGVLSPAVFDCADAWGASCVPNEGHHTVECEAK